MAGIMKRSFSAAVNWSIDRVPDKSLLQRALPILALLVTINVLMNAWQSWYDFRAGDELAARRLDVQTALIAGRVSDQLRDVNAMTIAMTRLLEAGTLTDATLASLIDAFENPLRRTLVGVFDYDPPDGHLLASSRPGVVNEVPPLGEFIAKVRANPSLTLIQPAAWGHRGALVVAKAHRDRAAKLDAIIIMVVTFERLLLEGVDLAPGTSVLLRDGENRVIVRSQMPQQLSVGQVLADEGVARRGPTAATQYVRSRIDGVDRLVSTRKIATGLTSDHWKLTVGDAVSDYRTSLWRSLYINVGASAVAVVMLVGGMWLIRRERELHARVLGFASTVSTIVENVPTPIAVVDHDTEKILLANGALLAVFGAVAGAGQSFPRLFVDAANWSEARKTRSEDAIPMLTRDGTRYMLVDCAQLEFMREAATSGPLLVTLVDVTHQQQLLKQLRTEADFDGLTGLANRRYFERAAQLAVEHARQQHNPLSVLALDLDLFKHVNDTYGHAAGDRVLQVVARIFEGVLRDTDLAARIGGEEFAAILLDTSLEQARVIAERIRTTLQNTPVVLESAQTISQTVSIGIAIYSESEADLVPTQERADAALYSAKGAGRNRVQIFAPEAPAPQESV